MKIKLLTQIKKGGQIYSEGSIIEIEDDRVSKWISKGWCEQIKKEAKVKKETKELKIDSKETKDATNKD